MKLTIVATVLLLMPAIVAYNPFKGSHRAAAAIKEQVNLSGFNHEFDPTALLESRPHNSEIYTKAIIELTRLESEQTCHRLAAQMLMNNCRDVKEMGDEDSQLRITQSHHVESFANGLTLCDLSRGKFVVSDTCALFSPSALLRAYQGGRGKLDASHQQTTACIEALAKDHSQWLTWRQNRDNALIFCRAVRLDIDKDETINLHKELTRLMAEFAEGLELDLEHAKQAMAAHTREMDAHFESAVDRAGLLKSTIQGSFEVLTNGVQDVSYSVKAALGSIVDLERMMQVLLKTVIQSNAEVAAEQEKAAISTTDLAASRMTGLNALAEDTSLTLSYMKNAIDQLIPTIIELKERQDATEQQSKYLLAALKNMTYTVNDHAESIEHASFAAKIINSELEKASAAAKAWSNMFAQPGDWALRIAGPVIALFFLGHGIPSTPTMNAILFFGGLAFAEILLQLRPWAWTWNSIAWTYNSASPSSVTQLAREKFGSLVTTPVEIEIELV